METIKHYSGFPATGVSLRQMVQFGEKPSTGILNSYLLPLNSSTNCVLVKARSSVHPNSSLKSSLSGWPIGFKSLVSCLTI